MGHKLHFKQIKMRDTICRESKGLAAKEQDAAQVYLQTLGWDSLAFISDQCEEIEENKRIGNTRDLFKKIRDIKETFHAKTDSIMDRNGMDLTEAEDTKRWLEYTEELYKKDLHDTDDHDGVTTHLEPNILECEVKWALGSITMNKASGGDVIPVELFQKDEIFEKMML